VRFRGLLCTVLTCLSVDFATAQSASPTKHWPTASPRSVGLDPEALGHLDADIRIGKYGYLDAILIIRHGKVVYDRAYKHNYDSIYKKEASTPSPLNAHDLSGPYNYFNPWWHPFYRRGHLHTLQSVTKTITSVIIGVATARKQFPSLDSPILQFFDTNGVQNIDDRKRRVTIRHLMTMTAGLEWNEHLPYENPNNSALVMEASFDWVKYAIDRPMLHEPGNVFNYSSGSTQLLSHIFRVAVGEDIEEYAHDHLFKPLGITDYFWKRTPTGLVDTEGGLYLEAHDLARIAFLFLQDGVWDGVPIVQPEWVKASVSPIVSVSADGVKYGLSWWLSPYGRDGSRLAWAGSGFGGQMPIVLKDCDLIIVFTGWNILESRPHLSQKVAISRVLGALSDRACSDRMRRN
jgi:CubicO group peptidase (beta-lactamase class C family)